ncbi:hypothetical protein PV04_08143 [Phialophora macrospora]|uniref:Uncharacterized protein n=1 Tax=Phialophora macrospora TaxID=1851006 RepID=A0A0D2G1F4_9EURO|nr:hypothetical protein PV04_08143 [Phialophora macrospora]
MTAIGSSTPISADEDESDFFLAEDSHITKPHNTIRRSIICFGSVVLATIALIALLVKRTTLSCAAQAAPMGNQFLATSTDTVQPCGTSTEEALQKGCVLDIMSRSWLPASHYDEALTRAFLRVDDWEWWPHAGVNRPGEEKVTTRDPIPLNAIADGSYSGPLWVSWRYHMYHCAFMWRKFHRDLLAGRIVDEYLGAYNHTEHCSSVLTREDVDLDEVGVQLVEKFPRYVDGKQM